MNKKKSFATLLFIALFSFVGSGCLTSDPFKTVDPKDKVILTVNGDKITEKELRRELAIRAAQDPNFKVSSPVVAQQLDIMVNRRILIQEATQRKLAEQEVFLNTIRNFWEQTLIRDLLNQLSKEGVKSATVSEAEINDYYSKLSKKVVFEIARDAQKSVIDGLVEQLKLGREIVWTQKVGPASYEEISSPALEDAFSLQPRTYKTYSENGLHYLIRVASNEPTTVPELSSIRSRIEAQIKQRKQQAALEQWLKEKRSKAKIRLITIKKNQATKPVATKADTAKNK